MTLCHDRTLVRDCTTEGVYPGGKGICRTQQASDVVSRLGYKGRLLVRRSFDAKGGETAFFVAGLRRLAAGNACYWQRIIHK